MPESKRIFNDSEILKDLKKLMRAADRAILEIYNSKELAKSFKSDKSPVTAADLAAHEILVKGLSEITPEIPVVSEEDPLSLSLHENCIAYWLIDPLDGTKEFINRNDEFTCNLALIENNTPTLGFVTVPTLGDLYIGGKGFGATKEGSDKKEEKIEYCAKPGTTRIVASKSHLNEETIAFIGQLKGEIELIQAGSSLKFLKIATGDADIYPRLAPTCEWDTAAAQAILEGAGGKVVDFEKRTPLVYGKENIINPYFIASAT